MSVDLITRFEDGLKGRRCTIARYEHVRTFDFGEGCSITMSAPWRIVLPTGIAFASADDGQRFGLPHPVDGEAISNALLDEHRVKSATVSLVTADLCLVFENEARVELFNNSSGYEPWQGGAKSEGGSVGIIAMGGGALSVFRG